MQRQMHTATYLLYAGRMDLNLLKALDVLLDEGSVVGAARRLHLSQPAMSRTLARLREATGDAIFVRSGRMMVPTPFAASARAKVKELVSDGSTLLKPNRTFSPETAERTFSIRCPEVLATFLTLKLAQPPFSNYRSLRFRFLLERSDEADSFKDGESDVEINAAAPRSANVQSRVLGHDHLVVVSRRSGRFSRRPMTLRRFAEREHILVSRRGKLQDPIDALLAAHGLERRVVLSVPNSASALLAASQTDLLVTVPERISMQMLQTLGLQVARIPAPLEPIPIVLSWHQRFDSDPGHLWLQRTLENVLRPAQPRT